MVQRIDLAVPRGDRFRQGPDLAGLRGHVRRQRFDLPCFRFGVLGQGFDLSGFRFHVRRQRADLPVFHFGVLCQGLDLQVPVLDLGFLRGDLFRHAVVVRGVKHAQCDSRDSEDRDDRERNALFHVRVPLMLFLSSDDAFWIIPWFPENRKTCRASPFPCPRSFSVL